MGVRMGQRWALIFSTINGAYTCLQVLPRGLNEDSVTGGLQSPWPVRRALSVAADMDDLG